MWVKAWLLQSSLFSWDHFGICCPCRRCCLPAGAPRGPLQGTSVIRGAVQGSGGAGGQGACKAQDGGGSYWTGAAWRKQPMILLCCGRRGGVILMTDNFDGSMEWCWILIGLWIWILIEIVVGPYNLKKEWQVTRHVFSAVRKAE
jgi:hypothetical protein